MRFAVQEMRVGPSEPACRSRLQTTPESWRSRVAVGSVRGKGAHDVSGEGHGDERKRTVMTPFIALSSINKLELLPQIFGKIHVVTEVIEECTAGGMISVPDLRTKPWVV